MALLAAHTSVALTTSVNAPPATATASLTAAVLAASAVHTAAAWKWCYLCTYSGECRCRF